MNSQHENKIHELIESFSAVLKIECEKLYRSGMLDIDSYDPDQYLLSKVVLTAALHRMKDDCAPRHDKELMRDVKNLINT